MEFITYDEFKKTDIYNDFIAKNSSLGYLKVQATTAYGAMAVADTEITIYKDIGEYNVIFFRGKTDSSGIIDNIALPAPEMIESKDFEIPEYTVYELSAVNLGYETIKKYSIGMFGGIKVIQNIKMTPQVNLGENL